MSLIFFPSEEMLSKCVNNHLDEECNNGVCRSAKDREITEESGDAPEKAFEFVFKSLRYYTTERFTKKYIGGREDKESLK